MKTKLSFIIFIIIANTNLVIAQGYKINVNIKGWQDTTLMLGHYFNSKISINDTIHLNDKGKGIFNGKNKLPGGMYILCMPNQHIFNFIIDGEQNFSLSFDKKNPIHTLVVKHNKQELVFNNFQRFVTNQQDLKNSLLKQLKIKAVKTDSIIYIKKKINTLNTETEQLCNKLITQNRGKFISTFISGIQHVKTPKQLDNDNNVQLKEYEYYKNHYFDNMNMKDDRLLLTPYFTNKLNNFFKNIVFQVPDSLNKETKRVITMSKGCKKMEKYLIQYCFNMVNKSNIMGMDNVMADLANTYYLSGKADWVDKVFLNKLREHINHLKQNMIGNIAPDLKLRSPENNFYRLSEIYANYTILIFWEPDCGHCKEEIPKLKKLIHDKYKSKGVKVFAVFTQLEKEPWVKFINKNQLYEWTNVYDPYKQSNFSELYNIHTTPTVYILDKDKRIIAKNISIENIDKFLNYRYQQRNLAN